MAVIEVKPRKWGWCVFEAPGVEPVFLEKDQAIGYAETRVRLRTGGDTVKIEFDDSSKEKLGRLTKSVCTTK